MATVEQKICCEHQVRKLLAEQGLPEPTYVEYGFTCIRLMWEQSRVALRVDIDDEATCEEVILIDVPHPSQPPEPADESELPEFYDPLVRHAEVRTLN